MSNSIAIALAWPETRCKQTGSWYDLPAEILGISKNRYYKVGHSAIVLINPKNGECHYFDFGRYHAPYGHGRVRDKITDHDLNITTKALFNENLNLINYQEVIDEIQQNPSCHGDGQLHAGLSMINFKKAFKKAKQMQNKGAINYGPFVIKGTNCSRFVNSILINSCVSNYIKLKLLFTPTISPTPIGIVRSLNKQLRATLKKPSFSESKLEECKVLSS